MVPLHTLAACIALGKYFSSVDQGERPVDLPLNIISLFWLVTCSIFVSAVRLHDSISEEAHHYLIFDL